MAATTACSLIRGAASLEGSKLRNAFESPQQVPRRCGVVVVRAAKGGKEKGDEEDKKGEGEEVRKGEKTSLFTSLTDALDFAQVRSDKDAELLYDARQATKSGEKMTREQYGALRRKIGGTYRDFFKDSVEVNGAYTDEGWVDKKCRYCKQDTGGSPRQVDKMGRYAHVACAENAASGNFFTRLFGR